MYENGKVRPAETILSIGEGEVKENDEGVNLTGIYFKHFCKCHNVPPVQQLYDNKNIKKERKANVVYME
jgi:hypothetical protein